MMCRIRTVPFGSKDGRRDTFLPKHSSSKKYAPAKKDDELEMVLTRRHILLALFDANDDDGDGGRS